MVLVISLVGATCAARSSGVLMSGAEYCMMCTPGGRVAWYARGGGRAITKEHQEAHRQH